MELTAWQPFKNENRRKDCIQNNGSNSVELNDVKPKISSIRLLRTSFMYQTKEFFNNSTLHGVRYIAEANRPFGERLMWFGFTAIGFISALVIIVSLWEKCQTNPTITGLDMDVHNQQLVFPTIVVCPIESHDLNRTVDFASSQLGNANDDSDVFVPFLTWLPQLTFENMEMVFEQASNISENAQYVKAIDSKPLRTFAFSVGIHCNETFDVCKYRDEEIKCCDHFHSIYSEHGLCYAFNPRYIDEATTEVVNEKYHEIFETDKKWALFFTPKRDAKVFVLAHLENFGYDFRPHVIWEPDFAAELLISMKQTYTTDDARQLTINQRKCIFSDEVKLQFYEGDYTFSSCMKECRIKKCIQFCGCIPPFYRPIQSLNYCKMKDLECLARHARNITDVRNCHHCELSCANTVYEIEKLSKTMADPSNSLDIYVNIEFLTWPIIRYKREVLFGWVDLLVSFGGIAGLFLGFSLLSGVEIIYYFTLRTCCMLYKNRQELYEIEEKKLMKPQERIDLSLKLMKRNGVEESQWQNVRRIEVAEIGSHVEKSQAENVNSRSSNGINDTSTIDMKRVATKLVAAQHLGHLNRLPTSYDYAHTDGPYYIP